ncbi:MAG TPA: thioredoxin family protein [Flavobacteriia bacterium]|nr:thioredoxin family protein [Flavobacteriia bacterium]
MKKQFLYSILFFAIAISNVYGQKKSIDLNWQTDMAEAKKLATAQGKLILIYFTGSDWSKSSKMLNKDFFYTEKFQKIAAKNFILVRVNSPRRPDLISNLQKDKNLELKKKYGQKVIPTIVLTDAKGNSLGMLERYNYLHDTSKHYKLIEDVLKKKGD